MDHKDDQPVFPAAVKPKSDPPGSLGPMDVPAEVRPHVDWARQQLATAQYPELWALSYTSAHTQAAAAGTCVPRETWAQCYALYLVATEHLGGEAQ